jgi:hypothetical protein
MLLELTDLQDGWAYRTDNTREYFMVWLRWFRGDLDKRTLAKAFNDFLKVI